MAEAFRELSPDEDFTPFAKGEFPATYGGPMGGPVAPKAPAAPKGFRELSADEEFIPDKPSLVQRATGAVQGAARSALPYLPGFSGPRPAPLPDIVPPPVQQGLPPTAPLPALPVAPAPTMPAPPKTYEGRPVVQNPDGSWSHERSMTIEADGKHMNIPTMFGGKQVDPDKAVEIMRNNKWVDPDTGKPVQTFKSQAEALAAAQQKEAAQQQILPPVSPAPAPQAPSLFAGIADRLKSLATPPPRGQMQERPEYTTPTANEPMPAPAGAQRVRIENEAAKGWKARLGSIAQAAGDYFSAEPAHEGPTGLGPAAQMLTPFPGIMKALQGNPPITYESKPTGRQITVPGFPGTFAEQEKQPVTDVGALLNPLPEAVSGAFSVGMDAIEKVAGHNARKAMEDAMSAFPAYGPGFFSPLFQGAKYGFSRGGRIFDTSHYNPFEPGIGEKPGAAGSARAAGAPGSIRDLSPEEAAMVSKYVQASSDEHIAAGLRVMDPNSDPRYAIYEAEFQRRKGGGTQVPTAPKTTVQPAGPTGGLLPEGPIEPAPAAPAAAPPAPRPKGPAPAAPAGFTEIAPDTPIEPLGKAPAVTSPKEPPEVSQAVVDEMKRGLAEEKPVGVPPSPLTPEQQRMAAKVAPVTGPKPEAQVASAEGAKERLGALTEEGEKLHAQQVKEAEAEEKAGGELWAGTVDAKTGAITSRYTKQQAQDADWHHNMYMSAADLKAVEQGQRHIFYMGAEGEPVFTAHGRDLTPEENKFLSERFTPPAEAKEPITEETKTSVPEAKPAQPKYPKGDTRGYNRDVAQATFQKFKTALTRAQNAKDWPKVIEEATRFNDYYEKSGEPFPDDWSRWERAKEDAEIALRREKIDRETTGIGVTRTETGQGGRDAAKKKGRRRIINERLKQINQGREVAIDMAINDKGASLRKLEAEEAALLEERKQLDNEIEASAREEAKPKAEKPTMMNRPPPGGWTEADKVPTAEQRKADRLDKLVALWEDFNHKARLAEQRNEPNRAIAFDNSANNIKGQIQEEFGEEGLKAIGRIKPEEGKPEAPKEPGPETGYEREATQLKIGDAIRVMSIDSILAKQEIIGGVRYELYNAEKLKDQRAAIRVVDQDSGHVVSLKQFPFYDGAEAEFNKAVGMARATSGEEAKPKEPTAAEAKIAALEEEQRQLKEKLGKRETAKAKADERVKAAKGETTPQSFKVEITTDGKDYSANALRFATKEEAQAYESDIMGRWMGAKDSRVVPATEPVNRKWDDGQAKAVDTEGGKPQIEGAEEGPKDVRQPIKGPSPVDVRQRAGVREGAGGEEAATGTGEEYPEPSDTGDYVDEQAVGEGNEPPGGIRPGASVRHPQGRPGVHRPGEAGAPVAGRPAEDIESAGGPGGVPGPPGEAQPEVTERNADKNYVLSRDYDWIPEGAKSRIRANLAAIKLVKKLQAENLFATSDEKGILAKYTGWGAFPQMFDEGKAAYRTRPGTTQQQITEAANWEKNWGALYDEVKAALTPEERTAASRSIRNAHYTSREVVNGVWAGLEKLGFKGGKALEPAVGSGNIVGLTPEKLRNKIDWKAIELDNISAAIAQKLYPEATVVHNGFQNVPLQRDYDLVVTNVPFAAEGPSEHNPRRLSLHNFFIDRSINELKPGGIAALITSDSTMDRAISESARRLFSEKADLVGAIRLPNTAFAENAGTEVTTDILFFRKKDDLSYSGQFKGEPFIETKAGQTYKGEPVNINEYFVDHPDMMLGRMSLEGKMYRRPGAGEVPDQSMQALLPNVDEAGEPLPLGPQLEKAMQKLPKLPKGAGQILDEMVGKVPELPQAEKVEGKEYKPGSFALDKAGDVKFINDQGQYETPEWSNNPTKVAQAKKYIALRDAALDLINKEASDVPDASLEPTRRQLNKLYDDYVNRYGAINLRASRFLEDDYHFNTPITLEKEVSKIIERRNAKGDLIPTKQTSYVKETIFSKRAGFHHQEPQSADTVEEGLDLSMNQKGGVDTKYIAQLTGKDVETVESALRRSGAAFENPKTKKWEDRTEYLSGFTKLKLKDAQKAVEKDRRFQANVDELEKVQPEPIAIEDITTNVGSDWIPKEHYQNFIQDTLGIKARVNYTPTTSTWEIQPQGGGDELRNEANTTVYGVRGDTEVTPGEEPEEIVPKPGLAILNDMLNGRQTEVQKRIHVINADGGEDIRYRKSEKKTLEAQEKRRQLQQKFNEFVHADDARSKELETIYNEKKNIAVLPEYPVPTWKHYPNANPDITLRDDQKKDVSRMLRNSVGIFQAPGNGKTWIATTAGMELKRLGLAKKVLYVVHNATAEQAPKAVKKLYPAANVLAPTKRDFEAQNRQRLLSRIATGDYDMIIIPQSFANLIPDDPIRMIGYVNDRLAELRAAIIEARRAGGERSPTAKNLQKKVDALEKRLTAIQKLRKDKGLTFEQLGVDAIITDEAHEYKSLDFDTQMGNIKGLANQGGDRGKYALSMYMKFRHVQEKTGGRNTYFLTGTPINNTIGEAWTMMRFLRPDILEAYGITNFDQFAAQFGRIATKPEFTAAGTWQEVTRFEGFENAPTILKAWLENSSVVTTDMIDLPGLPPIRGGKVRGVLIQQTPEFKKYIKYLRRRLEDYAAMDGKAKRQMSYIPVVTQGLGAKASLDMRMVDPSAPDRPESKLSVAAKDIYDIYKETTPVKGTQMVFADTRYDDPEEQNFDLYKDLKRKLMAHGIPEKEIVIMEDNIQGARRAAVFEAFGRGEIRVVIGHSQRMGVGVDAPEHGVGVHDLDAPHQPMFIEQRHARLVRQGNVVALKRGVDVVTYGVDGSLDAARWQRLSGKQRAFDQLMRGSAKGKFVADPLNELEFSFQEQLALYSGDPRAAEKVQLETAVRQMQGLKKSHEQSVRRAKERLPELEKDIPEQKAKIKSAETDAKRLAAAFQDPNAIDLQIAGSSYKGTPSDFRGEKPKHPILSNFFDAEIKSVPKGEDGAYHGPQKQAFTINGVPVITEVYTPNENISLGDMRKGKVGKRLYDDTIVHWRFDLPNAGWRQAAGPNGFFTGLGNELTSIAGEPQRLSDKLAVMERNQRELQGYGKQAFERGPELERSQKRLDELTAELQAAGPAKEPNLAELEADEEAIQHYALMDAERRLKYSRRNLEAWERKQPKDEDAATEQEKQIAKLTLRIQEAEQDIEEIRAGHRKRDLTKVQEKYKEAKAEEEGGGKSLDAVSAENQADVEKARTAEKQRGSVFIQGRREPHPTSEQIFSDRKLNEALGTSAAKDRRDVINDIKERFMRIFEYEREVKDQPQFVDALRRFQGERQRAFHESGKDMDGVVGKLKNRQELMRFSAIVQIRDMVSRLKSGQKVQAGIDLKQAEQALTEATSGASPEVTAAVKKHFRLVRAIGEEKVERGWMSPEAIRDDYFRHRVLMYGDRGRTGKPSRIRPPGKEKAAKGSTLPIERDYLKVMFDYIAEHRFKKALDDFIDDQAKKLDKTRDVKAAMGADYKLKPGQVVEINGRKIKGFQFDPGNYIYPEITEVDSAVNKGIRKQLEEAGIANIDEMMLDETLAEGMVEKKKLIIGRKKPTYALDLNVANRLEKFSGPNIDSDFIRAINKATAKWKGLTINFGGTAFQLMNLMGDVANMSRADLGSLGYIPKAARMLLRKDIDAKVLIKLAEELEVINSGFIGSEVTRLLETPEFRRFNTPWKKLIDTPGLLADRVLAASEYRENIPRLALFLKNVARLQGGQTELLNTLKKVTEGEPLAPATEKLGLAKPLKTAEVDVSELPPVHGAAKVARDILVDYRKFTPDEDRFLRGMFLPFYAWAKQNASGWARFAWKHPFKFAGLVLAPWAMMELWNNLVFPEEEDGLKKYLRENPHLITGYRDKDGKMIVLDLGALPGAAAARVFGLGALPSQLSRLMRERTTLDKAARRILIDVLKSPASTAADLLTPFLKIPAEIIGNRSFFTGAKVVPQRKIGTDEEQKLKARYAVEGLVRPAREARSIIDQIAEDKYDFASSRYGLGLPLRKTQGEGWIEQFYELYDEALQSKKTAALYKGQRRREDYKEYRKENREEIQLAGPLGNTAQHLARLSRTKDIIRENKDLDAKAKGLRMDALTKRMVAYAKMAVEKEGRRSSVNE